MKHQPPGPQIIRKGVAEALEARSPSTLKARAEALEHQAMACEKYYGSPDFHVDSFIAGYSLKTD